MEIVGKKVLTKNIKICAFLFFLIFNARTNASDLIAVIERKLTPMNQYDSDYKGHGYWLQTDKQIASLGYIDHGKKNGIWIYFQMSTSNLKEVRAYHSDTLKAIFKCEETGYSRFSFMDDSSFVRNNFSVEYFEDSIIIPNNRFGIQDLSNQDFFKGFSNDSELRMQIEFIDGISFCLQQNVNLDPVISFNIQSGNDYHLIINFVKDSLKTGPYKLSQIFYSNQKKLNGQRFIFNSKNGELAAVIEYRNGFIFGKTTVFDDEKTQIVSVDFVKGKATRQISKTEKLILSKYFYSYRRFYFPKLEPENPWISRYTNWENQQFLDGYLGTSANGSIYRKATGLPRYLVR